jgi:hypothetical protein
MPHCEVPHKQGWTKGTNCLKYHAVDKAETTADCLEYQFTPHDLCEENHERQVEDRVQTLLIAVDSDPP